MFRTKKQASVHSHQTKQWEKDCIKTRRSNWLRRRRLKLFCVSKNAYVLDLGCGDGLNAKILIQTGVKNLIGVDISKYLLKLAVRRNPKTRFILAPAEKLPFRNNTFDMVLVDSVFHHLIDHPQSLDEVHRVLKKTGYLCFSEPHKSTLRKIFDLLTLSPIAYIIPYLKTRKPAYLAERDLMNNWLEEENYFLSLIEKSGFKKIFRKYDLLSVIGKYQKV